MYICTKLISQKFCLKCIYSITHTREFSLTHFWQKFRESTKWFTKELIWRNISRWVRISRFSIYFAILWHSSSSTLWKLQKTLTECYFHEIFAKNFRIFLNTHQCTVWLSHTVWKNGKFTAMQFFSSNQFRVNFFSKKFLSRIFSRTFSTLCLWYSDDQCKGFAKFSSNHFFFVHTLISRNIWNGCFPKPYK